MAPAAPTTSECRGRLFSSRARSPSGTRTSCSSSTVSVCREPNATCATRRSPGRTSPANTRRPAISKRSGNFQQISINDDDFSISATTFLGEENGAESALSCNIKIVRYITHPSHSHACKDALEEERAFHDGPEEEATDQDEYAAQCPEEEACRPERRPVRQRRWPCPSSSSGLPVSRGGGRVQAPGGGAPGLDRREDPRHAARASEEEPPQESDEDFAYRCHAVHKKAEEASERCLR